MPKLLLDMDNNQIRKRLFILQKPWTSSKLFQPENDPIIDRDAAGELLDRSVVDARSTVL